MPRALTPLLFVLFFAIAFNSHAADKTWVGSNGGDWNAPSNWSPAGVPGAADTAIFNSTTNTSGVIDDPFNIGAMRIEAGYTATITASATGSLRVNGLGGTAGYEQADGSVDLTVGLEMLFQNTFKITGGTFRGANKGTQLDDVSVEGGTLDGNVASVPNNYFIVRNFSQSGGTFIADSGLRFTVNGSWTYTGGTFNPNGGTVSFNPSGASTINAGGANGAFNNVIYFAGNNLSLAATDMVVNGMFTQTAPVGGSATFDTNGRTFTAGAISPILAGVFFANGGTVTFTAGVRIAGSTNLINNSPLNGELRAGTGTVNTGDLVLEGSTMASVGAGTWTLGTGQFNISGNYNRNNGAGVAPPIFNRGTNTVNFVQNTGGFQGINAGVSPVASNTDGRFYNINKSGVSTLRVNTNPLTIINNLTNSGVMEATLFPLTVNGVYQSNSGFLDSTGTSSLLNGSTVLNGGYVTGVRVANSLTLTGSTITTPGTIELVSPGGGAPVPITVAEGVTFTTGCTFTGANFRKEGPGTLEIRSLNALVASTGTNSVNAGSFVSETSSSIGGATLQVNAGGTYVGRGLAPAVSVSAGGILFPGGSTSGQLETSGAVTLVEGAIFRSRIASANAADIGKLLTNQAITLGNATLNLQVTALTPTLGNKYVIINNTSANPITGTFAGLPEGGKLSFDNRAFSISYVGGTGNDVELTSIANSAPSVSSAAAAVPAITNVNKPISFTAAATDTENGALSFTWNFGDGTTGTGASVSHTYTAAGTYNAVVTISDGEFSVVSGVSVKILPTNNTTSIVGQGADADGDGFSDAFETAAGTDPANPVSTPTGAVAVTETVKELVISKVGIKLNFAKNASDSISLAGTLDVPADFVVANQKIIIDVGGVAKALTLSEKGAVKVGGDSFKMTIKAKKGVVLAQTSKFSAAFTKGTFASQLADENLTGAADVKNVSTPIVITFFFNNTALQKTQTVKYSAKTGKTGAAK